MKRIAIAIVILPVSFAILWIAFAFITLYLGVLGTSLADLFHLDPGGLFKDPQATVQAAQTAWAAEMKQSGLGTQMVSQLVAAHLQQFGNNQEPACFLWFTVAAGLGAIIFALSRLSGPMENALLGPRKFLTAVLAWSYSFALVFSLVVVLAFALGGFLAGFSAGFNPPTTDSFRSPEQAKLDAQKPMSDAMQAFDTQYGVMIVAGSVFVAALAALYIARRVVQSDALPWCRRWVPPTSASGYRIPG